MTSGTVFALQPSMLILILMLLALIFFALATFSVPSHPRFQFVSAGLFCLTLVYLLRTFPHLS